MSAYVMLMKADRASGLGLLVSGKAGASQQEAAVRRLGGTVKGQWAVSGSYDLVVVCDFPTRESAFAFGMLQTAAGFYTDTLEAFEPDDVDRAAALLDQLRVAAPVEVT